jgi:integrase
MKTKLTPGFVLRAPLPQSPKDREIYWDSTQPGFGLVVTAKGERRYVVQYRVGHRSRRLHLRQGLSLNDARKEAKKHIGDVARGLDPINEREKAQERRGNTFQAIADEYLAVGKTAKGGKLRSVEARRAILTRLVYPKLGAKPIGELRKSDIVRMLDRIEAEIGAPTAQLVLAFVARIMNWHERRCHHDEFRSPARNIEPYYSQKEHARDRILSDGEIRAVWRAAEAHTGLFGPLVQFLLLTAARRTEAASMARSELVGDVWTIPASRYKAKIDHAIPLTPAARAVLDRLPKIGDAKVVFSGDGRRPFSGFTKGKAAFDDACGVTGWTLHDLRRTARSLMSRAGVSSDIAERCLGHVLPAMRATYDRHKYLAEKQHAFEALSALVSRIINNTADNVVSLRGASNG